MKWIGQHIWDFISRFRSDVYLENITDHGSDPDRFLTMDSTTGKVSYRTGSEVLSDIGASSEATDLEFSGATANGVLTYGGAAQIDVESTLTYSSNTINIGAADDDNSYIKRVPGSSSDGGDLYVMAGYAHGSDNSGGNLWLSAGSSTGSADGGSIKFISTVAGSGGGSEAVNTPVEIAALDKSGNLQIDGGLTTGSTSFVNSSGVVQVATQGTINHDSLANSGGNKHIDWTGASAGTIHSTNIPTLNQSTTGNAATATALTSGDKTIEGSLTLGDTDGTLVAISCQAHDDGNGSGLQIRAGNATEGQTDKNGGLLSLWGGQGTGTGIDEIRFYTHPAAGSTGTSLNTTSTKVATMTNDGKVRVDGGTLQGPVDGDLLIASDGNMTFRIDGDNDSTSTQSFAWQNNASTEIANLNESGDLQIDGGLTTGSTSAINSSGLIQVANQSNITGVGTISSGTWQGTVIASDYLDTDTAHLSGTQTFSGTKTFSNTISGSIDGNAATATTAQGITGATDGDVTITSDAGVVVKLNADSSVDAYHQKFQITNSSDTEVAYVNELGDLQIDGDLTVSGGDIFSATDGTLRLASDTGMTFKIDADGDGTNTFDFMGYNTIIAQLDETGSLTLGDTDGTAVSITTPAHDNGNGSDFQVKAGDATAGQTNKSGGTLSLWGGQGTGTGANEIRFYTYPAGSTGTSLNNTSLKAVTITNDGNLRVDGNVITNSLSAANFSMLSSRILELQHAGSYNIQMGNSTNPDVLTVAGDSEVVTVNGALNVTGIITGKQREVFFQNFFDDIGTTKHYLPFKTRDEQTYIYQEEAAAVMPCDGRIVSVTLRLMFVSGFTSSDVTIGVHTRPVNQSAFTTADWNEEETEMITIDANDDNHVLHFAFDNAKHFESSELVSISIQSTEDISGSNYWYVSTVVEYDWSTFLGTTSAEIESTP